MGWCAHGLGRADKGWLVPGPRQACGDGQH
jgi:hypothetical protein